MKLDIFTLFPEAFDWFQSQRSVQNAVAEGNELRLFNYRDTTPLGAGQVDDAPYGGGAGMVLRVDVVDAALQAAYANGERPRVVLLSPTGPTARRRAGRRADGGAACGAALRALRGIRRAGARALRRRRGLDRPLRAGRRGAAGDGGGRRGDAQAAGGAGARAQRGRGVLQPGAGGRCPSTRTTPVPPATGAGGCPRCWSPATTSGCGSGGRSRAGREPSSSNKAAE